MRKTGNPGQERLPDREAREAAVSDLEQSMAVEASAGTGKTSLIVERAVNLIAGGRAGIHEMAVITFTDKAATELEERIRARIEERIESRKRTLSAGAPSLPGLDIELERLLAARLDLDRASIQTIHAFAASLLRRRPVEARVDPDFAVPDPESQRALQEEVWESFLANQERERGESLRELLLSDIKLDELRELADRFIENRDLVDAGSPVRSARPDPARHIRALGDWGGEQLRWMIAGCSSASDKLLVEIQEALATLRRTEALPASSLHRALLGKSLRCSGKKLGSKGHWDSAMLDRARAIPGEWNSRLDQYHKDFGAFLAGEASYWLKGFLERYRSHKQARGVLDFQDLLIGARDQLANPKVAEEFRGIYPYILVDEFQDTDPLQMQLVAFLTGAREESDLQSRAPLGGSLFIVGDPKQSIYRFRRADVALYARTREWLRERAGPGAIRTITSNFRCQPGIAGWVNALFERLFAEGSGGTLTYAHLDARRAAGDSDPVLYLLPDPAADAPDAASSRSRPEWRALEASAIARTVRSALDAGRWKVAQERTGGWRPARYGDIVILLRGFGDVSHYEQALRDEGIECLTSAGREYFVRAEVAWFGALLRAVESPRDQVAVVAALRSPFFGLSDEAILAAHLSGGGFDPLRPERSTGTVGRALGLIGEWHRRRNDAPVETAVRSILEESGGLVLAAIRREGERSALNLLKVVDLARRHDLDGGTFRSFVRWLGRASRESFEESDSPILETPEGAVRIMTIHAAKGLEFPIVVLADLSRSLNQRDTFLVERATGRVAFGLGTRESRFVSREFEAMQANEAAERRAERRRLLYVAATRARDLLILPIFGSEQRDSFLADLEAGGGIPELQADRAAPQAPEGRVGPAARRVAGHGPRSERPEESIRLPNGAPARVASGMPDALGTADAGRAGAVQAEDEGSAAPEATLGEWSARRRRLLESASAGPCLLAASRAAPSELGGADFAAGSSRAAAGGDPPGLRGELPAVHEARLRARARARAFGLAVHAVLESADLSEPSTLKEPARAHCTAQGRPEMAAEVESTARRALGLRTILRARTRRALRETPVAFLENGVIVEGLIDLAYEEDDGSLVVVDYKTDAVRDAGEAQVRAEAYREQMALYAIALERATGRAVRESVLLFLAAGTEVHFPHDEAARALAGAAIARAALPAPPGLE